MNERVTVSNENKIQRNQFNHIQDKDLRCRNIATMILNHKEDDGEDVALEYAALNIQGKDEEHVKGWVMKLAQERGYKVVKH